MAGCTVDLPSGPTSNRSRTAGSVAGAPIVDTEQGPVIADQLVVAVSPDAEGALLEAAAPLGGQLAWRAPRSGAVVLRFADAGAARAARATLAAVPGVTSVEADAVLEGSGISTSPGPVKLQWNLWAMGLDPRRRGASGAGVRVALLDSGVAYEDYSDGSGTYAVAPDLAGVAFAPGWDFVNDDAHPNDDQGHGTHMAGIIAADQGIRAIAGGAEILPVKVLDSTNRGTELELAEGIYYAVDNGADVINMALSFHPAHFPGRLLSHAVDYAAAHGVVMVASVGNHGSELVAYPAAFRDVIAVGASALQDDFHPHTWLPWLRAKRNLERAGYSNRGWAVDLVAPGGRVDRDLDGDGNPEAIVAQTFSGDPTQFDYYLSAGTSPAAAEVSAMAAAMLHRDGGLEPDQLRALLGSTASRDGWARLDADTGRGYARADLAFHLAGKWWARRPAEHHFVGISVVMREHDGDRVAEATVEVLDQDGDPVRHATVYGTFMGNVLARTSARTDHHGVVTFDSPPLDGDAVVAAFQVDAVEVGGSVDRPQGFVRIDSCSLETLSGFVTGSGISTSPSRIPFTMSYDPTILPADAVPTYTLLNYTWNGALEPIAVAVDAPWLETEFSSVPQSNVTTMGLGITTSPLTIDPDTSFDPSVLAAWQPPETGDECVALIVHTFAATRPMESPVLVDPQGDCKRGHHCDDIDGALQQMWLAHAMGISTSPVWEPGTGLDQALFTHLDDLVQLYVQFSRTDASYAVGAFGGVLQAAGIGLTPVSPVPTSGTGMALANP